MQGRAVMSREELHRTRVLEQVLVEGMSLIRAAVTLDVSCRHAKRPKRCCVEASLIGLVHGAWPVWHRYGTMATHPTTEIGEPVRFWKRRMLGDPKGTRTILQVYLSSRLAPLPKGTQSRASEGDTTSPPPASRPRFRPPR